jgi:hypothetical protein
METPMRTLALTVGPVERARRALEATRAILRKLDAEPSGDSRKAP